MRRNHSVIGCPRHIYVVFFFAHILFVVNHTFNAQRSGRNNISSFLQRTAPIARFFCEGWIRHDLHILVTAPFCCNRKARAACAQSFAPWQKATIEIMRRNHSIIGCSRYICFFSSRTSRLWWITQSTQHHRRGRNSILLLWPLPVVIAKLRFVTISTIMCLSAGPTRGGTKGTSYLGPAGTGRMKIRTLCVSVIKPKITCVCQLLVCQLIYFYILVW